MTASSHSQQQYQPQSYQQLHQQYQQQSAQPKNMYGQQQSPKPMASDMYDQQQLLRTQSQSNSQYGLSNKASIASTSSNSNQTYGQHRGQGQTSSMQQSVGNSSGY